MKSLVTSAVVCAVLFGAFAMAQSAADPQGAVAKTRHLPRYVVTDLKTLGGNTSAFAGGLNNRGWVNGASYLPGNTTQHAVLWRDGQTIDLGTLGGPNSSASFPLNDAGLVAGGSEISATDPNGESFCANYLGFPSDQLICVAFAWQNGVMIPLPTLGGNNGNANQVNNLGQITGSTENATFDPTCSTPTLEQKPVIWRNGRIEEVLPLPSGYVDGLGIGINDRGDVVGWAGNCVGNVRGLLWRKGTFTYIGNLGGSYTTPQSVNDQNQAVGNASLPGDTAVHGFFWQKGVTTDLGTLSGDSSSAAYGINDGGQVVGQSCDANSNCRAVLVQNGVMTDLNTLVPPNPQLYLLTAFDVNSRGQIEGIGLETSTGELHNFLLTPVGGDDDNFLPATTSQKAPALSDDARKLLQRMGRFGGRRMMPQ